MAESNVEEDGMFNHNKISDMCNILHILYSKMSDNIINPAPAQISFSSISNNNNSQVDLSPHDRSIEDKINDLNRSLRIFKNISQPINQYLEFQQIMDPKLRVIIDVNQWVMLMLAGKSALISLIEDDYADIKDPPEDLIKSMHNFYNDIDILSDSFTNSMKQIITLMQSQILSSPPDQIHSSETNSVLAAMSKSVHPKQKERNAYYKSNH